MTRGKEGSPPCSNSTLRAREVSREWPSHSSLGCPSRARTGAFLGTPKNLLVTLTTCLRGHLQSCVSVLKSLPSRAPTVWAILSHLGVCTAPSPTSLERAVALPVCPHPQSSGLKKPPLPCHFLELFSLGVPTVLCWFLWDRHSSVYSDWYVSHYPANHRGTEAAHVVYGAPAAPRLLPGTGGPEDCALRYVL